VALCHLASSAGGRSRRGGSEEEEGGGGREGAKKRRTGRKDWVKWGAYEQSHLSNDKVKMQAGRKEEGKGDEEEESIVVSWSSQSGRRIWS